MLEEWALSVPLWTTLIVIAVSTAVWLIYIVSTQINSDDDDDDNDNKQQPESGGNPGIPWAPGSIPILGHALSYRRDPSGFLLQTCQTTGSIFQLNLAGKHMIVVAGPDAQRQVAKAPERILSARQAVADIGFEETLGSLNVHQGTDLHKGIVKGIWQRNPREQFLGWKTALKSAMEIEMGDSGLHSADSDTTTSTSPSTSTTTKQVELFQFLRRVILRATVDRMIGPKFLDAGINKDDVLFLNEFMAFQDQLEDVTAKAVVLPRWFALPALLWPVRRQREKLQMRIAKRLDEMLSKNHNDKNDDDDDDDDDDDKNSSGQVGFWLAQMYPRYSVTDIAEYIVGLLFAAHKNPAIGAAQAYLMLHEHCSETDRQAVVSDARTLLSYSQNSSGEEQGEDEDWSSKFTGLRRLCLETLRLTAHSIGAVRTVQEDFYIRVVAEEEGNGTGNGSSSNARSYRIPKGASIALTHITPSLNPQLWGSEASKFDLHAHSVLSYQDEYRFTTFSHGVHKCPGQQLAVVILQCTVALLLENYNITLPPRIPPLSFERATLAQREGPVWIQIQTREIGDTLK